MNTKTLVLAGIATLGIATLANAQSKVYMTGSTAGRAAVFATMSDNTGSGVFDVGTVQIIPVTATGSSTYVNFRGTIGGVDTMVKCFWTGSEGGYSDLVGTPATETFLSDDGTTVNDPETVDLCAADTSPQFSKLTSAQQGTVTASFVAVIPFKWVKQKGSAAGLTGVTDQTIRQAMKANARLALFTGVDTDTTYVYLSGRDNNSGTRVNEMGTCGFGIFAAPSMVAINSDGSMKQVGSAYSGDVGFGYSGGGSLAAQMGYDLTQVTSIDKVPLHGGGHFSVIAFLGMSDAGTAIGNGATLLTYDGVPFSILAIEEGQYNAWGNYHIAKKNSGLNAQAPTVYSQLISATVGVPAHADDTVLIKKTSMKATRQGPTTDPVR